MKYKNNILLIFGNIVSKSGSNIHRIALNMWIISITNNAQLLGWISGISFIPQLIFNFIAGYFADTYNRKHILIITDFISGIACLIFSLFVNINVVNVSFVITVNIILLLCNALFSPTLRALVPCIITKETLKKTNAILTNLTELVKLISPALTTYLMSLDFITIKTLFIINGISFILSSISEMFIDYYYHRATKKQFKEVIVTISEGFKYIKSNRSLFKLIIFAMLTNLFLAGYDVLLPYYSEVILQQPNFYGIALSFEAVGAVASSILVYFSRKENISFNDIAKSTIPQGIALAICSYPNRYILILGIFCFGFFLGKFNILFFTYVQTKCDEKYLGRTFAVIFTIVGILMPAGNIIFGYLTQLLKNYTFLVIGFGIIIATISLYTKPKI